MAMSEAGASFEMIPVDKCDACDGDGWVHVWSQDGMSVVADRDCDECSGTGDAEIGRLLQRESMLEARIEVLELTIARLRAVCDAAFTVVRWDGEEDSLSAWQELVSALEDANYTPVDNSDG